MKRHARNEPRRRFEARNDRLEREKLKRDSELTQQKEAARRAGPAAIAEILKRKQQEKEDD